LSLATNDSSMDGRGEWQERVEWHNLVAHQRNAEILRDYVKKGSRIYVEGTLRTRSWDDKKSGEKKYRTEVVVLELTLLWSAQSSHRLNGSGQYRTETDSTPYGQYAGHEITREEVPY
jgi:single-strand DNA-binding protein